MPGKPETDDRQVERSEQIQYQSSIYSHQPWWRVAGEIENASKSSLVDVNKQGQPMVSPSQFGTDKSGGDVAKEQQNIKHVLSSNSQMDLVGHSIVLTSPYSDAQYDRSFTAFVQPMINPQLYGIHRARMLLPLEMEEEPVYVNAKQYHGILRRRQSRAKAELEKKVIKARKPYLHESRHQHALKRSRGIGGRFLNTRKLEHNSSNLTLEDSIHTGANSSTSSPASQNLLANNENLGSPNASKSMVQDMHKVQSFNIGYHGGSSFTALFHSQAGGKREGDCFGKERDPNGAIK